VASQAESVEWYFARNGQQHGPITYAQLVQQARGGMLSPGDLIWKEGMSEWQPAARVGGLFDPAGPASKSPPPLPRADARPVPMPAPLGYATPQSRPQHDIGQDAGIRMLIPVGRSGWAIASGYLGLIALFPLVGLPFAIGAIVTGILAIREIRRDPTKHGMGRAIFGLIAGGLMTVVSSIFAIMLLVNR